MPSLTGAEAIVKSLQQNGVDTIFGLPGGQLDHLFDAIYKTEGKIKLIHSRHEQGAAYMAFGYARSTGRLGVYTVVPGPGLLNTTAALCTAYACNAPVLCLTGQIPSAGIGTGRGYLHEIPDQLGLIQKLTKWAARIDHPTQAPDLVREAFKQLQTGRPRPVLRSPIKRLLLIPSRSNKSQSSFAWRKDQYSWWGVERNMRVRRSCGWRKCCKHP
jgi:acetolactate synthase-1/2/3 large subunit